jgi:chromosome segregation ATPase
MAPELVQAFGPAAAAVIAAAVTWALTSAKRRAETNNLIVDAASEAITAIRAVMDELQKELAEAQKDAQALKEANAALREQVEAARAEVVALRELIAMTKGFPQIGRRQADPALKAS